MLCDKVQENVRYKCYSVYFASAILSNL